ncbi:unnamed protein product [Bemisia tabaci]|uniref:SAM domain-containing protein n=1 Tax=Bemisia tabaci TaxID=7038 RepID=A0A9P0F5Q2_BEMTA|nr:unnamed protein product [Bemisia tabaci]
MDKETEAFIRRIGLERYVDAFKEDEVTFEDLILFTDSSASKLIPKTGPRLRFLKAIADLKPSELPKKLEPSENFKPVEVADLKPLTKLDHVVDADKEIDALYEILTNSDEYPSKDDKGPSKDDQGPSKDDQGPSKDDQGPSKDDQGPSKDDKGPSNKTGDLNAKPRELYDKVCRGIGAKCIDTYELGNASPAEVKELQDFISEVLDASLDGKYVKDAFKKHVVTGKIREMLQTILITHIQNSCVNHKITPNKFKYLALAVSAAFPGESKNIYYIPKPPSSKDSKKNIGPKGQLYQKYQYRIKLFKRTGFFEKQSSEKPSVLNNEPVVNLLSELDPSVDQTKLEEDHKWVQNSYSPYDIFEEKWLSTIHLRLKPLHDNTNLQIHQYLEKYPVYKKEIGATVIRVDFNCLFPGKENVLVTTWPALKNILKVVAVKATAEPQYKTFVDNEFPLFALRDSLNEEEKSLLALRTLPSLFAPLPGKKREKFSRKEIVDDFMLFVPSDNEIEIELKRRDEKLKKSGRQAQPLPVVSGTECPHCAVVFNNYVYNVETPIDALDLCFKLIMVLNAEFSLISNQVWSLIQQHIFKITTPFDAKIPSVEAVASTLGLISSSQ